MTSIEADNSGASSNSSFLNRNQWMIAGAAAIVLASAFWIEKRK